MDLVTMINTGDSVLKVRFDGPPGQPPVVNAEVAPGETIQLPRLYVESGAVAKMYPALQRGEKPQPVAEAPEEVSPSPLPDVPVASSVEVRRSRKSKKSRAKVE